MNAEILLQLFERMFLIRTVEERITSEYSSRNIRGPVHLSVGQEAVAAGVLLACRASDCCVSTHRNHAHYLAKGGSLAGMVDELYGLDTGCCKGYGGSMHLFDKNVNMWGSSAIVGGSIPICAGIAFALKNSGTDDVCIGFMGDGGADEGAFYESLNLTALLGLPVLFVVENNGVSTLTPQAKRQARTDIVAKAESFGVDGLRIDGNDVVQVYETASGMLNNVRCSGKPFLLEATTYRMCAHVGPVVYTGAGIGADDELSIQLSKEPITVFKAKIKSQHPGLLETLAGIERDIVATVDAAFESGKARFASENEKFKLTAPPPPDPSRV